MKPALPALMMLLTALVANGQSPTAFEVASIKPSTAGGPRIIMPPQPGGRFVATNVTVQQLIQRAYGAMGTLEGAPSWVGSDGFDIVAKAGADFAPPTLRVLLQDLLKTRFKLAVHTETRQGEQMALTVARRDGALGPKMKTSSSKCSATTGPPPAPPLDNRSLERPTCGFVMVPGELLGGGVSAGQLAMIVGRMLERPVIDRTGLSGSYDVDLAWSPDQQSSTVPALLTALQEQLGLKVESQRAAVDAFVVDHVERPTPD